MAYLPDSAPFDELKALLIAPASYLDELEESDPGWIAGQLAYLSAWIDSRLRKRYAAPFESPYPVAVQGWLAALIDPLIYLKRGVDPTDKQIAEVIARKDLAIAEIKEAADSKEGLFDLPVRSDSTATGISKGSPLAYSEASPYTWSPLQQLAADDE